MIRSISLAFCLNLSAWFSIAYSQIPGLALKDGDRVVFLGDALIEQEQYSSWVETMLTATHPKLNLTFRNLGWTGDTPAGDSRFGLSLLQAGKEPADEGWQQLIKQLQLTQPSVLVLGYGMANSLDDDRVGIQQFVSDYQRLLKTVRQLSPEVRFLLLSPLTSLDTNGAQAQRAADYARAIRDLAQQWEAAYWDITEFAQDSGLRKDPIHLNETGYRELASAMSRWLELSDWSAHPNLEVLRQAIVRKNEWWFHRSRPANMAYVFGFRKHEQGQNAVEIPQYDQLILEEEQRIAQLRRLEPISQQEVSAKLESKFAEFTEQPIPEFTIDPEWEVTLWAQNPQLNKPIHMSFDPEGRLWVASSEAYPMIEVGQSAPDKIVVLQDTNGDGRSDQSTVFAEGLLIPTGIAPGNGGVYVAQSTDLLFMQDTNGDGRADTKERILSGFGTEDTHHNLHTLRWGPDGRLYMNQSVYTRTDAETPHGVVRLKAGGGFRFDPRSLQMDIFFRGLWNSWGHQFDAYGQSFLSDGAGFAGLAYTFPGATFNPTPGARRQLDLISPGNWPKFASLEIVRGAAFPAEWQGSIITCDFRANRVTRFSLRDDGAGFVTQQEADLLRTSAPTFRPIDVKLGPDGALYIADWSNPIINHGEVDFRDSRRDRWHGRIWRVSWKGAKKKVPQNYETLATTTLLDLLKSDDAYDQDQARRVLISRREAVLPALAVWIANQSSSADRLQALWLYQGLDAPAIDLLRVLLADNEFRVRAAAARVLSNWADPNMRPNQLLASAEALDLFATLVADEHPRVRLEAVHGLSRLGSLEAAQLAMQVLERPVDRFVEHALGLAVDQLGPTIMAAIENGDWRLDSELGQRQLEFVLTAVRPELATTFLQRELQASALDRQGSGPWIELIAQAGGAAELQQLFDRACNDGFEQAATVRAIRALTDAQRLRRVRPSRDLSRIEALFSSPATDVRDAAITLAGVWKLNRQAAGLLSIAVDSQSQMSTRQAAAEALRAIGVTSIADRLVSGIEHVDAPQLRLALLLALADSQPDRAAAPLVELLSKMPSEQEALAPWRAALSIQGFGKRLASHVSASNLSEWVLQAGVRACRDGGRNEPELLDALAQMVQTSSAEPITRERILELAALASDGDAERGELIYRRSQLACATCHAIGGVGGRVGPDISSLGASAPIDYIVESLFLPDAKIKEGFHSVSVVTEDGQVFSGVETASTAEELVLRDANNKLIRIPQAEVAGRKAGPSLMPTGVIDRLSEQEQVDLICFLSKLGKPGRYDASRSGVARMLEIFAGTHRIEQNGAERIVQGQITEGWKPVQSFVDGSVPKEILLELTKQPINIALVHVYVKAQFSSTDGGKTTFLLPSDVACWIDGKEVTLDQQASPNGADTVAFSANVSRGQHTLILRLDARGLPARFSLTSPDVTFIANE